MRTPMTTKFCSLLLLCAIVADGAWSDDRGETDLWQKTDLDLGFLKEEIGSRACSRSDLAFLSCIGAVQRALDLHGRDLNLIPGADHPPGDSRRRAARFGAAVVVEDPSLRVRAEGNALAVIRARTNRILRWRERLDRRLREGVDFDALRRWLTIEIIDREREKTYAAGVIDGYLSVADAHARIAPVAAAASAGPPARLPSGAAEALVYSGIGAGIQPVADAAMVTAVVPGGPAALAGIRPHDFILEVDGRSVTGLSSEALVQRLRGRSDTEVALRIKRQDGLLDLAVRRDQVRVRNVTASAFIDRGWQFAYINIDGFMRPDTCEDARRALDEHLTPTLNGLLLDLRGNAGGLIDQAVCVADLFLPEDTLVIEIRKLASGAATERIQTQQAARARVPMVTLVDAATGSASEVLAGALQDHGRSLIVGELTFGKGSVQTVRPWRGSTSVMEFYTAARYYRPSGVGVQLVGIEPDIEAREEPGPPPRQRIVLRERELFPTALPREPEMWKHPDPDRVAELRECTMAEGLSIRRMRPDAQMSRATDYALAVGQDALVCRLTWRL